MKQLFTIFFLLTAFASLAQQPYLPSTDGQSISRPVGATNFPTDARSYFHDRTNFTYRPYVSTAEVLSTLNTSLHRKGNFVVIVNTGGTLASGVITGGTNDEYWFKNCLADTCLVLKTSGSTIIGGTADTSIIRTSKYGAIGNGTTDDRAAIQAAINAAAPFGGRVIVDKPGTYIIGTVTTGGIKRGLTMAANVSFYTPPGVILKLANSQVTNATPVQLIHVPITATNVYIGWPSAPGTGATLDGNVANQPGYTLGFSQTNGNYLIGTANGVNGVTIEGLKLTGAFSNSINVGGSNTYGNSFNIRISNIYQEHFGEGMQIISADNVLVNNIVSVADSAQIEGDIVELSHCRYFSVTNTRVTTSTGRSIAKGGSGVDLYASRYGTVSNFFMQGVVYGMQIETSFTDNTKYPDDISVSNGVMEGINFAALWLTGGRVSVSNVQAYNNVFCGSQMYKFASVGSNFIFSNVTFTGKANVLVSDNVTFTGHNLTINATTDASALSLGTATVDIDGLIASQDLTNSLVIVAENAFPVGRIININAPDGMRPIIAGGEYELHASGLVMQANPPFTTTSGSATALVGVNVATSNGTILSYNIPNGTKGQILKILGTYSPWIIAGARIVLNNADSVYLGNPKDFIVLEFGADSIWRQTGGFITSAAEIDPIFGAINPYLMRKDLYQTNIVDADNYFRLGFRMPSLDLSTRPPVAGTLLKGEINGSSWYGDGLTQGFLRLSAGGTSDKSYIDIAGTNGDATFSNNITFGLLGAEKFSIAENLNYSNNPLVLNYPLLSTDSNNVGASTKWVKERIVAAGGFGGGGGSGVDILPLNNTFTGSNTFSNNTNGLYTQSVSNASAGTAAQARISLFNNSGIASGKGGTLFLMSSNWTGGYANAFGVWNYENGPVIFAANNDEKVRIGTNGILQYAANYNGSMTNFSIPNKKYVDSAIAVNVTNVYFDSTAFSGTGDSLLPITLKPYYFDSTKFSGTGTLANPVTLKYGGYVEPTTSYTVAATVGYIHYKGTGTATITLPTASTSQGRIITIHNASAFDLTLSPAVTFVEGGVSVSKIRKSQSIVLIAGTSFWKVLSASGRAFLTDYANNAAAIAAGLDVGEFYQTSGAVKVVF